MTDLCFNVSNYSPHFGPDVPLERALDAAVGAGFELVGLDVPYISAYLDRGHSLDDLASALDRRNLRCYELAAVEGGSDIDACLDGARFVMEIARAIRAQCLLTYLTAPPERAVVALLEQVAELAVGAGARLAVEPLPWSPLNAIGQARSLVREIGVDRTGVLVDTWHFFRGPSAWPDLVGLPVEEIAYIQFDDALPLVSDDLENETMTRRAFPGEGELPLQEFCDCLIANGFDGVISIEVLSESMRRDLDVEIYARRVWETTAPMWRV